MNLNKWGDFQICISVPLSNVMELRFSRVKYFQEFTNQASLYPAKDKIKISKGVRKQSRKRKNIEVLKMNKLLFYGLAINIKSGY